MLNLYVIKHFHGYICNYRRCSGFIHVSELLPSVSSVFILPRVRGVLRHKRSHYHTTERKGQLVAGPSSTYRRVLYPSSGALYQTFDNMRREGRRERLNQKKNYLNFYATQFCSSLDLLVHFHTSYKQRHRKRISVRLFFPQITYYDNCMQMSFSLSVRKAVNAECKFLHVVAIGY